MAVKKKFPKSGSSHSFATGIRWVGAPREWVEDETFSLSSDEYGVHSLTREYNMRRDTPIESVPPPSKGDYDHQWKNLLVFDWSLRAKGPWLNLTVRYNGFLNGRDSGLKVEEKNLFVREQTVYASQIVGIDEDRRVNLSRSLNIRYLAPSLTRKYAMTTEPKFRDPYEDRSFKDDIQVLEIVIGDTGVVVDPSDFDRVMSYYDLRSQQRSVRTQLSIRKEGAIYRVAETIERQIIQAPTFNALLKK
jgi:hypothetical protein